jgi:dTDP-4-amino-4,6-dideoxygalactose transaminase
MQGQSCVCGGGSGNGSADPTLIEAAITEHTKAIIAVHLYGQMAP